jgi:hypothetical protein
MKEKTDSVMKTRYVIPLALLIVLAPGRSTGQSTEVWLDYFANIPAGRFWTYEFNGGMAKGLSDPVWLDAYLTANATYQDQNWLSTEGNLEYHYTFNATAENIAEIRPWLGANFIWSTYGGPLNLFYPAFGVRLEERLLWYQTSGAQESKERLRLRASARFPLNNESLIPETYYLILLLESYVPLDGEAKEVSADKLRFQAGLGYVLAADLRIELQYIMMRSRNTQLNTFEVSNHIIWLSVRNFFY